MFKKPKIGTVANSSGMGQGEKVSVWDFMPLYLKIGANINHENLMKTWLDVVD